HRHRSGFHAISNAIPWPDAVALRDRSSVRSFLADLGVQRTPIHGTILLGVERWIRQSNRTDATRRRTGPGPVSEARTTEAGHQRAGVSAHSGRAALCNSQRFTGTTAGIGFLFAGSRRFVLDRIAPYARKAR